MSSEQPRRARETGGSGGSPIGSTAAIIIAVVAVVGGFLILRAINDDDDGGGSTTITPIDTSTGVTAAPGDTSDAAVTTLPGSETTLSVETTVATPTTPPAQTTGATVIVANASTVDGAAGRFTTALAGAGFTMADATNNSGPDFPVSVVYYVGGDAAAQAVATYLSSLLGNISVEPMPTPPPVADGALPDGVTVLLMLGSDKADKTLAEAGAPATTTIPAGGTATTAGATTVATTTP